MIHLYRRWMFKRRVRKARKLLMLIDESAKKIGMPRYKRKQMWRDFSKMKDGHAAILDMLEVK